MLKKNKYVYGWVDYRYLRFLRGYNIIQVIWVVMGVDFPRFCYDERLHIVGNCRMCLIQIGGEEKLRPSCKVPFLENLVIFTGTERVFKAQLAVLEFLLINHPLDCPVCDQGGECDLQDLTVLYGKDKGRFNLYFSRGVLDLQIGLILKTYMSRCIYCTRCVRFCDEVLGSSEMGVFGRGYYSEVGIYVSDFLQGGLVGNLVDICPVGALTARSFMFKGRGWELDGVESIDILDGMCSNIRLDIYGNNIVRVLPRLNEFINEEWISDKVRFAYDGLQVNRLVSPMIRIGIIYSKWKDYKLVMVSWVFIFRYIYKIFQMKYFINIEVFLNEVFDSCIILMFKVFFGTLGGAVRYEAPYRSLEAPFRYMYLFNAGYLGLEFSANFILVGCDSRLEMPLMDVRLRRAYVRYRALIFTVGFCFENWSFSSRHLSSGIYSLYSWFECYLESIFVWKESCDVILGSSSLYRYDVNVVIRLFFKMSIDLNYYNKILRVNVCNYLVGRVSIEDMNLLMGVRQELKYMELNLSLSFSKKKMRSLVILCGWVKLLKRTLIHNNYIFYQGCYGNEYTMVSDIIFPLLEFSEQSVVYINDEGVSQFSYMAVSSPMDSRSAWYVWRALYEFFFYSFKDRKRNFYSDKFMNLYIYKDYLWGIAFYRLRRLLWLYNQVSGALSFKRRFIYSLKTCFKVGKKKKVLSLMLKKFDLVVYNVFKQFEVQLNSNFSSRFFLEEKFERLKGGVVFF